MLVWVLLLIFAGYSVWRLFLGYPPSRGCYRHVADREAAFLDAAAEAIFPAGTAIPFSGREADLPGYADTFLESIPKRVRLQVRAMFMLFEQATIFLPAPGRGGRRRFSSLSEEQRIAVLRGWSTSRLFPRRLAFTALRAVLTMGYLGHPVVLRSLRLAPFEIETPLCEADLLYPRVGERPESIRFGEADLSRSDGTPLDPRGPVHPDYLGDRPGPER